jgi:maltose alpha-D-glucosyltransferase/alpha-amylase
MIDRNDPHWYRKAVIYQLHVKSFFDANGDGVGDFQGLIDRLDYIRELGVTALWLMPFYPSPLRDDGYDISDYNAVNPSYGTMRDFRRFVAAAHERGLRIVTELVINHTSDQHRWFQRAREARPGSAWRNYYVWSDDDQKYDGTRIIFLDTEVSNWTWDPVAKQYFWHRFYSHQPDLNFDNPQVFEEVMRTLRFWLDMGVDGLRLDAVPYLVEREGTNNENLPETHDVLKRIRAEVDSRYPDRMLLAEANQWPEDTRPYFGAGDECHMAFHFPLMPRIYMAVAREDRYPITDILKQTPDLPDGCQWAIFLRNHDELTLEMVTDEERDYMYSEYAKDSMMRRNLGIRRRLAPLLENSRRKIELMNSLLLSLPGTPVIYYGDELGMGDNVFLGDRNGVRTPMQWSGDRNAGFSRADAARLYEPVIADPVYGFQAVNVEAQERLPTSLLEWTRRIIRVRKRYRAFGRGSLEFLNADNRTVLAYVRAYADEVLLCVVNLSRFVQPSQLDLSAYDGWQPTELIGETPFPPIGELPYFLTFGPHSFYWFRLERPSPVAA